MVIRAGKAPPSGAAIAECPRAASARAGSRNGWRARAFQPVGNEMQHRRARSNPVLQGRGAVSLLGALAALLTLTACEGSPASTRPASTPRVASSAAAPAVAAVAPRPCETFSGQVFTIGAYGITVPCPAGFSWEIFGSPYQEPSWRYRSRLVATRFAAADPPGQLELGAYSRDAADLRGWIAHHTGEPMSTSPGVYWDSVANLTDSAVGGAPAVSFDYTRRGPDGPPGFHAVAFFVGSDSVFVIDWWTFSSGYSESVAGAAREVVGGIRFTGRTSG